MQRNHRRFKKKVNSELQSYFPHRFDKNRGANALSELKAQTLALINSIKADHEGDKEEKEKNDKIVASIEDFILSMVPPNSFKEDDTNNIIHHMEISFEKLCASMEEAGIHDPKRLTAFEFYSRMEYFQSKNKKI